MRGCHVPIVLAATLAFVVIASSSCTLDTEGTGLGAMGGEAGTGGTHVWPDGSTGGTGGTDPDASVDAPVEDVTSEAPPEAAADVSSDVVADTPIDVVPDVMVDVVPDVAPDVVPDVVTDVVTDVVPDVVPDVVIDAVTDVVPDVVVEPPPTCNELFGDASQYVYCEETANTCKFSASTAGSNCKAMCESLGGTCVGAWDNGSDPCGVISWNDTCDTNRGTEICECTRP